VADAQSIESIGDRRLIGLQPAAGWSQQLYVYPAANQSPDQQSLDQQECHGWATQQSGYNPYATSSAQPSGGVLRGAASGAALGAIGGAIAGDAGEGAKIGAQTADKPQCERPARPTAARGPNWWAPSPPEPLPARPYPRSRTAA
jgi:hypothetical protein